MKNFRAIRDSLTECKIYDTDNRLVSSISWSAAKIWKTENAPLSRVLSDKIQAYPILNIESEQFTATRKLLSNNFLLNDFETSLYDENGQVAITAYLPSWSWRMQISYKGQDYDFIRRSLFRFDFVLRESDIDVCRITESTPFLTMDSRREFVISTGNTLDPVLFSFSFFLAHNWFF